MGSALDIIAAGDEWNPAAYGLEGVVRNLGRLTYAQTADLYRTCHLGVVMMYTRHPSYIPLELMASGCPVVTNTNPHTGWFFTPDENCRISENSAASLADAIAETLQDPALRSRLAQNGLQLIRRNYSSWDSSFSPLFAAMTAPLEAL
jgi:glycosyltransferase involved in cell wall biosynthesis